MSEYTREWLQRRIRALERRIDAMPTDDERLDDEREYWQRERANYQQWLKREQQNERDDE